MPSEPRVIDYYTLCTADCGEGSHVGEWIECDRCGAPTHVRVFEVDHPKHGLIRVGAECFKDVMGYNFTKTHEKAIETAESLVEWADTFNQAALRMDHPPRGEVVVLGLPGPLSGYKHIPVWLAFTGGRTDSSYNWDYTLRDLGVRPYPAAPYGWNNRLITAGLDLGLWEYVGESGFEFQHARDSVLYVMDVSNA